MVAGIDDVALGIGVASLVFEAFEGLRKGFIHFENAVNMPADCESYRLRLRIEFGRLLDWQQCAGLVEMAGQTRAISRLEVNKDTIMSVLGEIQLLLKKLRRFSLQNASTGEDGVAKTSLLTSAEVNAKSKIKHEDLDRYRAALCGTQGGAKEHHSSRSLLYIILSSSAVQSMRHIAKDTGDVVKEPKRLRWALSHKEKFAQGLDRLRQLTDHLHETLDDSNMQFLVQKSQETYMALLQLCGSVSEVKALLQASKAARHVQKSDSSPESPSSSSATLVQDIDTLQSGVLPRQRLEKLTEFRIDYLDLTTKTSRSLGYSSTKLTEKATVELQSSLQEAGVSGNHLRTRGFLNGTQIWVEWKSYKMINPTDGPPSVIDPDSISRMEDLTRLLMMKKNPPEFRIPTCHGFFNDEEETGKFGLVLSLPPYGSDSVSLLELVHDVNAPTSSLREKTRLALSIATYLLYLHAVNWLHKGLRSASVVFPKHDGKIDWTEPYISGFEFSRPDIAGSKKTTDIPDDSDWQLYCHPEYFRQSPDKHHFRRSYDIYSLGILLLEIATWKPIARIVSELADPPDVSTGGQPASTRSRLLSNLETVRATMGDLYHGAVYSCIASTGLLPYREGEDESIVNAIVQQAFLRNIIDPLRAIVV